MSQAIAWPGAAPAPLIPAGAADSEPVSKAAKARQVIGQALGSLAEDLNNGKSEGYRRYLAAMARFHDYSFGNVMLIMSQRPGATRVAGYRAWQKLGRQVRKGEKAIAIMAPMLFKPKDANATEEDAFLRFRAVSVFDVSQTDGEDLPEPPRVDGDPWHHWDRLTRFVEAEGIAIRVQFLGKVGGLSRGGTIVLNDELDEAERFSVLVHELAHEFMHQGPNQPEPRPPKAVCELEAESVAFVVCTAVGMKTGTASSDYIQSHGGNAELLGQSLQRVQKTAERILHGLLSDPHGEATDETPQDRSTDFPQGD
jgi:antirestriction protein ArdC